MVNFLGQLGIQTKESATLLKHVPDNTEKGTDDGQIFMSATEEFTINNFGNKLNKSPVKNEDIMQSMAAEEKELLEKQMEKSSKNLVKIKNKINLIAFDRTKTEMFVLALSFELSRRSMCCSILF